jgi:lysine 2,3-aminomutase
MSARSIAASASAAKWSGRRGSALLDPDAMERRSIISAAHDEIWEVILTGGDPLVLSPRRLREIMERLADIEHVKIIRFHTRVPVVDPEASMRR